LGTGGLWDERGSKKKKKKKNVKTKLHVQTQKFDHGVAKNGGESTLRNRSIMFLCESHFWPPEKGFTGAPRN